MTFPRCTCDERPGLLYAEIDGRSFGLSVFSWWRRPLNYVLAPLDLQLSRWVEWIHDAGCSKGGPA